MELIDQYWMNHALELARLGRGRVEPNPMVGCVLVRENDVISTGYHARFGGPHAEAVALDSVGNRAPGATAYVTLEPCCHRNKKTPPCVPALIEAGVERVVIGSHDPNPAVAGKGTTQLREAGLKVDVGVCELQARQLNAAFFARQEHGRPYVTLKWAQTANGIVAGENGRPIRITTQSSDRIVHQLRSLHDAIVVGIGTALTDDPLLTARTPQPARQPLRVVLDSKLRLSAQSRLAMTARESPVRVYCQTSAVMDRPKLKQLHDQGIEVVGLPDMSLDTVLSHLAETGATQVLVEPGPTLARAFLRANRADRVIRITSAEAQTIQMAPVAPELTFPAVSSFYIDGDCWEECFNPGSDVYYAAHPSADVRNLITSDTATSISWLA